MTSGFRRIGILIAGFALGLAGLAAAAYVALPLRSDLQVSAIGGPFALTATDGRTVTNADLEGRPYLVFFGYTHCPDFCPTALFDISQVFKAMGADKKIAALFITIDPARDTPEVMKDYLSNFDPRITGLSGDRAKTEAAEKAFRVYAKKVPARMAITRWITRRSSI